MAPARSAGRQVQCCDRPKAGPGHGHQVRHGSRVPRGERHCTRPARSRVAGAGGGQSFGGRVIAKQLPRPRGTAVVGNGTLRARDWVPGVSMFTRPVLYAFTEKSRQNLWGLLRSNSNTNILGVRNGRVIRGCAGVGLKTTPIRAIGGD